MTPKILLQDYDSLSYRAGWYIDFDGRIGRRGPFPSQAAAEQRRDEILRESGSFEAFIAEVQRKARRDFRKRLGLDPDE